MERQRTRSRAASPQIIAKLKPSTREGRRAAFGIRAAGPEDERPSQLARLIDNDRLRAIRPVFPEETIVRGARRGLAGTGQKAPVQRARGLVAVDVARGEDTERMASSTSRTSAVRSSSAYRATGAPHVREEEDAKIDPLMSRQWGHNAVRIAQARAVRGFVNATAITVAVADSGVDRAHPDLEGLVAE